MFDGGLCIDLGTRKQRILLATLLCHANTVMRVDQLIEAVWEDAPPRTARKNLQAYISSLRKIVQNGITHHAYGYVLHATAEELDLLKFDALVDAGRVAWRTHGDLDGAAALFRDALDLWSDRPLVDLLGSASIDAESARLDDRFLAVYEDWVDLEIAAGRHLETLKRLGELAGRHPLRERLTAATMIALARSGQRSAALAHYESHRQFIARELGLPPSPILQGLYQEILTDRPTGSVLAPHHGTTLRITGGAPAQAVLKPLQLPRRLTDFVARSAQIATLRATLFENDGDSDVAVVLGTTGAGKTALAVHAGHLVADRFTDGQIFVSLCDDEGHERAWRDILAELMRGTGMPGPPPMEAEAALAEWRSWVAQLRFLFVLDGATSEESLRRVLPGHGANRTLITSSLMLSGLESVQRVDADGFTVDEAACLLEQILGKRRLIGNDEAVARIVSRYGGLPLAIRRVAAKLTIHRYMSLNQYADQMERRTQVHGESDLDDVMLRSRFDRFYAGLTPLRQQGFRALGELDAPRADHHEVMAVLGGLDEPAGIVLEALLEANLLRSCDDTAAPYAVTYEMPALAHVYAALLHRRDAAQ